jgi:hypothetical protein
MGKLSNNKGEKFTKTARRIYIELEKLVLQGNRKVKDGVRQSWLSTARQLAPIAAAAGCQHADQIRQKHKDQFNEIRKGEVGKGQLSKDQGFFNMIFQKMGKHDLVVKRHDKSLTRTHEDRYRPKQWKRGGGKDGHEKRLEIQAKIEAKSIWAGLASRNSMENGCRLAASLTARWLLVKDIDPATGKVQLYSNWGTKDPGNDLKPINNRQLRYAYATDEERASKNPPKDWSFEREYIGGMQHGKVYLIEPRENKNGKMHLKMLVYDSQFQAVKAINKYCLEHRQKSLAPPEKTMRQAKRSYQYILRSCGLTKALAGMTLHVDRHEFIQRHTGTVPDEELIKWVGHGDVRKLDSYRP